ncbi:hypothetical protein B0H14DRAFT_3130474 [Mycena olivaceomarginata]|nr:hypothetical protein B0H14DRAFT_3130474 [Mycena olivaceomarginata]
MYSLCREGVLGTRLYSGQPGIQWRELHREKFECTAVEEREHAAPHIHGDAVADQGMGMLRVMEDFLRFRGREKRTRPEEFDWSLEHQILDPDIVYQHPRCGRDRASRLEGMGWFVEGTWWSGNKAAPVCAQENPKDLRFEHGRGGSSGGTYRYCCQGIILVTDDAVFAANQYHNDAQKNSHPRGWEWELFTGDFQHEFSAVISLNETNSLSKARLRRRNLRVHRLRGCAQATFKLVARGRDLGLTRRLAQYVPARLQATPNCDPSLPRTSFFAWIDTTANCNKSTRLQSCSPHILAEKWTHLYHYTARDRNGQEIEVGRSEMRWLLLAVKGFRHLAVLPVASTSNDSPKSNSLSGGFRNDRRQGASKCIGGSGNQRQDLTARQSRNGAVCIKYETEGRKGGREAEGSEWQGTSLRICTSIIQGGANRPILP